MNKNKPVMKVFISQPMSGVDEETIKRERELAEEDLLHLYGDRMSLTFIDSMVEEKAPEGLHGDQIGMWYLGKSIEKMAEADIIYFSRGYNNARGCRRERAIADSYMNNSFQILIENDRRFYDFTDRDKEEVCCR